MTDEVKVLSDDEVAEIEARTWAYPPSDEWLGAPQESRHVILTVTERDALCATVRALRQQLDEWESHREGIIEAVQTAEARVGGLESTNIDLREQLAHAVSVLKDVRRIVGAREIGADTESWIDEIIRKSE